MIFTAHPKTLSELWPHALPHLKRFAEETLLIDPEQLYKDILENQKQLWMFEDDGKVILAVVTEIWRAQLGQICTIKIAAGTCGHDVLRGVCDEIENWARNEGCVGIEICGRKGWSRVLDGFKQTGVILEKDLRKVH